jgi:hypothetical protein
MASNAKLTVFVPSGPHTAWRRPAHVGSSVGSTRTGGSDAREATGVARTLLPDSTAGHDSRTAVMTTDSVMSKPAALAPISSSELLRRLTAAGTVLDGGFETGASCTCVSWSAAG